MTPPTRPRPIYEELELRVDPEPVHRAMRDAETRDEFRSGGAVVWIVASWILAIALIAIAAYLIANRPAPRPAQTTDLAPSRDLSAIAEASSAGLTALVECEGDVFALYQTSRAGAEALRDVPGEPGAAISEVVPGEPTRDHGPETRSAGQGSSRGDASARRPVRVLRGDRGRLLDGRPSEQRRCGSPTEGQPGRPVLVGEDARGLGDFPTPDPVLELPSSGVDEGGLSAPGGVILRGKASWFDDGPGLYAAVHSYRFGDPTYTVRVCRRDARNTCVLVTVRDHMASTSKAIDLGPDAFVRLWPGIDRQKALYTYGVVDVVVETGMPEVTQPPTDVAP